MTAPLGTPPGSRARVLVVDDDPMVSRAVRRSLCDAHDLVVAESVARALEILEAERGAFDLVLCDLMMPGESGVALYEHVARAWPTLVPRVVILTGGATTPCTAAFLAAHRARVVEKPVTPRRLQSIARAAANGASIEDAILASRSDER